MKLERESVSSNPQPKTDAEEIERREKSLDEALKASFPASDPPAIIAPHSSEK